MTPEQQAAYVIAMAACVTAETAAMQAENQQRSHRGEAVAYNEQAFTDLINRYGIHHNAILSMFHG
jgi:hypothetical protein